MSARDDEIDACVEATCGPLLDEAGCSDEERIVACAMVRAAFDRYGNAVETENARLTAALAEAKTLIRETWCADWWDRRDAFLAKHGGA